MRIAGHFGTALREPQGVVRRASGYGRKSLKGAIGTASGGGLESFKGWAGELQGAVEKVPEIGGA
ncbi:MAG: hypothetical protein O3C10_01320 [Chloroflexi bacterium]|nr:hypothetical protein [Chloroflexota bacterium]